MKRHAIRGLVVALLGVPVLAFTALPAQAFTLEGVCGGSLHGERQGWFVADNGDLKGTGIWQWDWDDDANKYVYRLWAVDNATSDSASMITEVITSAGGSIPYQNKENYKITFGVSKYRFVWNGYPSSWFDPLSCRHA